MAYSTENSIQTLVYYRAIPPHPQDPESLPMLREQVEVAVRSLEAGQFPGVDNVRTEVLKNGGEATTTALTAICQTIWETEEWPKEWTNRQP